MSINDVLDSLDELLEKAWSLPLSGGRCVVDADRVTALIDEIRNNMPEEVKQARIIVEDRLSIIANAKKEAEQIIRRAEERARGLVKQEEITKQAQAQAAELLAATTARAREIRAASNEYADGILKDCEEQLGTSLNDIKLTRQKLKSKKTGA